MLMLCNYDFLPQLSCKHYLAFIVPCFTLQNKTILHTTIQKFHPDIIIVNPKPLSRKTQGLFYVWR